MVILTDQYGKINAISQLFIDSMPKFKTEIYKYDHFIY